MFNARSKQKELLDASDIPADALNRNLLELDIINTLLGGHAATIAALNQLSLPTYKTVHILDIGCGGGDTLKAIAKWARAKKLSVKLTGVDLKQDCINYAIKACAAYPEISLIKNDYRKLLQENIEADVVVNALFCHHLADEEISELIQWSVKMAKQAVIINDLHRHPFAYYSIAWLTRLFSRSYLVKNDAPLSVLRGFKKQEWLQILKAARIPVYTLTWQWAFRWIVLIPGANK
ncbi:MAG: methyltransferase domain-containing protein [Sphingobacteriales bacterium]|jgi:2-polyprenyl-3-methyl-5-hydroxy-6-metoxy-1,4-benzoquinol methylase|nr:methyltransferase domain-containing protein [Sphingobacteriales bacterium]